MAKEVTQPKADPKEAVDVVFSAEGAHQSVTRPAKDDEKAAPESVGAVQELKPLGE